MFGPRLKDFPATKKFYASHWQYENIEGLKRVVDTLVSGAISDGNTGMFRALYNRLLQGSSYEKAESYYVLAISTIIARREQGFMPLSQSDQLGKNVLEQHLRGVATLVPIVPFAIMPRTFGM